MNEGVHKDFTITSEWEFKLSGVLVEFETVFLPLHINSM